MEKQKDELSNSNLITNDQASSVLNVNNKTSGHKMKTVVA